MEKASDLATLKATREVLDAFGLSAKYALGQNFLVNDDVIKKILALAQVSSDDLILEVGPGIGTLTQALLKQGARVISVERDSDLPAVLAQTCGQYADRFALIEGDALNLTPEMLLKAEPGLSASFQSDPTKETGKFVANLPYGVAATLILQYFEQLPIASATVMVQKEVAERIAAVPGTKNYGAYTVKLRLYAQVVDKFLVKPSNFYPAPHVDSTVVRLDRRPLEWNGEVVDETLLKASALMADAAFASRRKTLLNSCKTFFSGRNAAGKDVALKLGDIFERASIEANRRGETLDTQEYVRLGAALLDITEGRI